MFQIHLEQYGENGYRIYRVPSIVCTRKGTIIVCYECRYGGDWSAMDLVLRRSEDGGGTWSERQLVASGNEIDVIHNGILFVCESQVHLLWHRNYRQAYHVVSDDEGRSWSRPEDITYAYLELRRQLPWTVIAAGPGHGLTTREQRMIVPVWAAYCREDITAHHPSVLTTLHSDDHGASWHCGEIIHAAPDFVDPNESVLAQLSDGSILINSRHETGGGLRKVGFSPDGIEAWHGFYFEPQLRDPVCAAGMTQDAERLWFVNCDASKEEGRRHLTVKQSCDDGKTWNILRELAVDGGYSDICYDATRNALWIIAETGRAIPEETFSFGLSVFKLPVDLP